MNLQKVIEELVSDVLLNDKPLTPKDQIKFLEYVYKHLELIPFNELLIIESAFNTYFITKTSDIKALSPMSLQNLYNVVDEKLKTANIQEFYV